jgi:membrane-associated phospholipid phosphatase
VDDGWTSEASSALALAGFLFLVFIGFTLLAMGPLVGIDAFFNLADPPAGWRPVLHVMDRIGQRAVCLPLLAIATLVCCRYRRSWRPAYLAVGSVLFLNFVVGLLKIGLGRGEPGSANPSFFAGGMAYPSGHTSNIVLVYGMAAFLLSRHRAVPRRAQYVMWGAVGLLSMVMVATSLTLNWHWFADLVAGLLVGASVLELTVGVDAALPATAFTRAPWQLLPQWWRWLRRRTETARAPVPDDPADGPQAAQVPQVPQQKRAPDQPPVSRAPTEPARPRARS